MDPYIFADTDPDPDPGSQNLADPTDPDPDPKHWFIGCLIDWTNDQSNECSFGLMPVQKD